MEKFLNLPVEKQNIIIDGALKCFGANGYKKASVSDIAAAAGISKAMVFHYFGTKKALYLYLINLCGNILMNAVNEKFDYTVTDFFERIKISTNIELSVMKKHPAIISFLKSVFFETDDEVIDDIKAIIGSVEGENFRNKIAFDGIDTSKFKDNIDLKLVMKMLTWIAEGFVNKTPGNTELEFEEIEALCKEFEECMDLLRNNFYKEEYL